MKRIVLVAIALAVAACTPNPDMPAEKQASATVTLLTHDSFALSQETIRAFEEESGIDLEILSGGDAGTMVAGAVLAAGQPTADVLFGVDNTLVTRAADAGVFDSYAPIEVDQLRTDLVSSVAGNIVTPVTYGDVCINIDREWFASNNAEPPQTLDDLIDPRYRDLLVVQDPGASSPGLAFLLTTVARYGDGWPEYWEQLRDNDVTVAGSWSDAYFGQFTVSGGDKPIVVSYATSPPAEIVYAEGEPPIQPKSVALTDGCYQQVEYAGVLAGAQNPDGAHKVIDWLISAPVQADIPLNMFVFPARNDTPLPDVFTQFAAQPDEPAILEPEFIANNVGRLLTDWDAIMGR